MVERLVVKNIIKTIIFLGVFIAYPRAQSFADNRAATTNALPIFISLVENINDFGRFADGGPDENWYVGFNNAWIVQLPSIAPGQYDRVFIGAKLGRAKTRQKHGRPWEREIIPGKIYVGISQTPFFSHDQSFFLVETPDIPLEPDARTYIQGSGQSQWFWAEIPRNLASFSKPNYLIVWSPTENFNSAATAPILAAAAERAAAGSAPHAWVNRSIQGVPPRKDSGNPGNPLSQLAPALAMKLVAPNDASVLVSDCSVERGETQFRISFSVFAENPEKAWLEISPDQLDWERLSKILRQPPYIFSVPLDQIPARGAYLRGVARDMLGNEGFCNSVTLSP